MKTPIMKILCAVAALILATRLTSYAYETTGQSVTKINDNYALFTIDYTFGFLNREAYVPIAASRGKSANKSDLEYEILGKDGHTVTNAGIVTALVLSRTKIKNDKYYLGQGDTGTFTLVGLMRLDGASGNNPALKITDIPLILVKNKRTTLTTFPAASFVNYRTEPLK